MKHGALQFDGRGDASWLMPNGQGVRGAARAHAVSQREGKGGEEIVLDVVAHEVGHLHERVLCPADGDVRLQAARHALEYQVVPCLAVQLLRLREEVS